MSTPWLRAAVLALGLSFATGSVGIAQAAEAERPVSGLVSRAQPHAGILHLGSMRFYVPDDVYDLDELSEGDRVVVSFERSGGQLLATAIEVDIEAE